MEPVSADYSRKRSSRVSARARHHDSPPGGGLIIIYGSIDDDASLGATRVGSRDAKAAGEPPTPRSDQHEVYSQRDEVTLAIEVEAARAARAVIFTAALTARRTAAAAEIARGERAHEAAWAAQGVADEAGRCAALIQVQARTEARRVAGAAAQAAAAVAAAPLLGSKAEATRTAERVAALVEAAANTKATETTMEAASRAMVVARTAEQVARVVAAADRARAAEARAAGDALLVEARGTAQRVAIRTREQVVLRVPGPKDGPESDVEPPEVGEQRQPTREW